MELRSQSFFYHYGSDGKTVVVEVVVVVAVVVVVVVGGGGGEAIVVALSQLSHMWRIQILWGLQNHHQIICVFKGKIKIFKTPIL